MSTSHLTHQSLNQGNAEQRFKKEILFAVEEYERIRRKERRALGKKLKKIKNDEF